MAIQNLFLGFGGTGAHILTYVKELAVQKHGTRPSHLEFLEFDTIARVHWVPGGTIKIAGNAGAQETIAKGSEVSLDPASEYFHLADSSTTFKDLCLDVLTNPITRANTYPQLNDWLHSDWLKKILPGAALDLTRGAAQQRQIGRYAMFANAAAIVTELSGRFRNMQARAGGDSVNVWICGSAAGGTGAGCIIDAAYMVRLAGKEVGVKKISMTGVIVLPEVYSDIFNDPTNDNHAASLARSYSFLRELDRVQFQAETIDEYDTGNGLAASDVRYTSGDNLHAGVTKLFDYRVYLSRPCRNESDRTEFFSSVANALDAFTDKNVSSDLLQDQNNATGAPIGFGAARLVFPKDTYEERFAWRQTRNFFQAITASNIVNGLPSEPVWGSDVDRGTAASNAAKTFLPLFKELLDKYVGRPAGEVDGYARAGLSPHEIVEKWFQLAGVTAAEYGVSDGDLQTLPVLLYCDPFRSLDVGADEAVEPRNILVKSFEENRRAKGVKEEQKSSGERVSRDLKTARDDYLSAQAGSGSFEKGLNFIKAINEKRLQRAVDSWIASSLAAAQSIGVDPARRDQGTSLTRLYREISLLIGGGALDDIARTIAQFKAAVATDGRDRRLEQNAVDSLATLDEAKRGTFSIGTWIEAPQQAARADMQAHIQWLQKSRLLDEMQRLTEVVRTRLIAWREQIRSVVIDSLVLGGANNDRSVLDKVRMRINDLDTRLGRMASNGSLLISLRKPGEPPPNRGEAGDTTMNGFEADLETRATISGGKSWSQDLLEKASWETAVDKSGVPSIALRIQGLAEAGPDGRKDMYQRVYQDVRNKVDVALRNIDVLDYLLHVQRLPGGGISPAQAIEQLLNKRPDLVLLEISGQKVPTVKLILRADGQSGEDKRLLAEKLDEELAKQTTNMTHKGMITHHSESDAITLFGVVDPDGYSQTINDVTKCGTQYLRSYTGLKGAQALTGLTYHGFRAEEEAWFMERSRQIEDGAGPTTLDGLIPPRITRLLEKPAMMRAFTHCLATGAIRCDSDTSIWSYYPKDGTAIPLTIVGPGEDLLRAAVVFVLQQRAYPNVLNRIKPEGAIEAAMAAALAAEIKNTVAGEGQPPTLAGAYTRALKDAKESKKLDDLVITHFFNKRFAKATEEGRKVLTREAEGLRQVFHFYLPFDSSTDLTRRSV